MRNLLLILLSILTLQSAAQDFARAKVWLEDPISTQIIQQRGLELDHGVIKPGVFIINDFAWDDLDWMRSQGVRFDVLIEDVPAHYRNRVIEPEARGNRSSCFDQANDSVRIPDNFTLGSMAGFYTYEEYLAQIDSMHSLYPDLITIRDSIDTFQTHEGRRIYWVKVSDNPTMNEEEPEVLYNAIHHAREPESLTQLIYYMWYILEGYGEDDEVTALADETEMYFVPMLNPDGYVHNQVNDPNGGGLWRKNKRDNGDGTFGVDLNRNYGYEWGHDNNGSSPNTSSQTYRGQEAFSEPETQAIKWFCEQHEFDLAFNYHSYGNYIIYPWGYNDQLTPDSSYFISIAEEFTKFNDYVFGTGIQTVGYSVNGDSDDWMYGEQTSKNKIFSMTPEVGTQADGFWPAQSRILPLSQENIHPNLLLAHLAGNYATIADASPQVLDTLSPTVEGIATRLGLEFDPPYTFSVEAVSGNISAAGSPIQYTSMNTGEEVPLQWTLTLDGSIQQGEEVVYDLVADFDGFEVRARVSKTYGVPTVLLTNNGDFDDFVAPSDWGTTDETYVSPSQSITDSPYAPYQNNVFSDLEYNRIIDLRESDKGYLRFEAKWAIEAGWDYAQILASPVDEENWSPLCGTYSVEGNQYQDLGQPVWDGFSLDWVAEEVALDDFIGERIKVKFRMVSDQYLTFDGFYFDDLEVVSILPDDLSQFPDTGYVDTIGTTPPDTTTGVNFISGSDSPWTIYPNPASDKIMISGASRSQVSVSILSLSGMVVRQTILDRGMVDVSDLPNGAYIIRIGDMMEGNSAHYRIVIQH